MEKPIIAGTGITLFTILGPIGLLITGIGVYYLYKFLKKRKALKAAKIVT